MKVVSTKTDFVKGFPTDAITIPGVTIKTAYDVTDGYQSKEDIIGEDGNLIAQVFSDDRTVVAFSGYLAGSTKPANGDEITVSGKKASLSGVKIAYTSKLAVCSGTVEIWDAPAT